MTWLDRVTAWVNGIKRDRESGRGKTWRRKGSADSLYVCGRKREKKRKGFSPPNYNLF